jgi:hypothetical protein
MRATTLFGFIAGMAALIAHPSPAASKPASAPARLIVKLSPAAQPAEVPWLERLLQVRVLQVMPGGEYLLVVAKPGTAPETVKKRSSRVVSVEREVPMKMTAAR